MKRLIGLILISIAFGMTIMLFITNAVFAAILIIALYAAGYKLYTHKK